jgi:hypothetical protein
VRTPQVESSSAVRARRERFALRNHTGIAIVSIEKATM